jgi:hypothetical protein
LVFLGSVVGAASGQSLGEVAKKEKARRKNNDSTAVRRVDEATLAENRSGTETATTYRAGSPSGYRESSRPESPLRRSDADSAPRPSPRTAEAEAPPPQTQGPPAVPGRMYVEDHLYGEENLRRLRREARHCRVRPEGSGCADAKQRADALEKLLEERRNPRAQPLSPPKEKTRP